MKNSKFKIQNLLKAAWLIIILSFLVSSCGYKIIGSEFLTFKSVTIKPVQNKTYEPGLEERMHNALSNEFIKQGIEVKAANGDVELQTVITTFALGAVGAVNETIKEQEVIMYVDIKVMDNGNITEFRSMRSPIKITFQSTGTVSESVAHKEKATDKACREIAREMVSRIIIKYAK
ncbi:hypothetical protein BMS3Abin06_00154 [bacterium BMS3Abin06]|nr:hypothetical protein BMS3Abin06_00154 [bacterium BMS3Abin06]